MLSPGVLVSFSLMCCEDGSTHFRTKPLRGRALGECCGSLWLPAHCRVTAPLLQMGPAAVWLSPASAMWIRHLPGRLAVSWNGHSLWVRPALAHPALPSAAGATLPPRATVPSCEPGLRRTDFSSGEARGAAWDDVSKQELATYSGDTVKYHLMYTSRLQVGLTWLLWP